MRVDGETIRLEELTCGQLVNKLNSIGINAYLTSSKIEMVPAIMILNFSNVGTSKVRYFSGTIPKAALSVKHPDSVVLSSDKKFKIQSVFAGNKEILTTKDIKTIKEENSQYIILDKDYTNVFISYSYLISKFVLFTSDSKNITSLPSVLGKDSLLISKKIMQKTVDSTYANNKL